MAVFVEFQPGIGVVQLFVQGAAGTRVRAEASGSLEVDEPSPPPGSTSTRTLRWQLPCRLTLGRTVTALLPDSTTTGSAPPTPRAPGSGPDPSPSVAHFRFAAQLDTTKAPAATSRLSGRDTAVARWRDGIRARGDTLKCRRCGHALLTRGFRFSKVAELPSAQWYEIIDCLSCHGDLPIPGGGQPGEPRPGWCLLGDTYLLLHGSDLAAGALTQNKPGAPSRCARCNLELGLPGANNVTRLFMSAVSLDRPSGLPFRDSCVGDIVSVMEDVTASSMCSRFLLHTPTSDRVLLLWCVTGRVMVLANSAGTTTSGTGRGGGGDAGQGPMRDWVAMEAFRSACKVMYAHVPPDQRPAAAWDQDATVERIEVALQALASLVASLQASTKAIPPSTRTSHLPGFRCGYLFRD